MKEGDLGDCGQVQMGWREYTIIVKVFVDRQRHHSYDDEDYPHPHPHHHHHHPHHQQRPVKESLPSQDREREEGNGSRRREGSWDDLTCNLHLPREIDDTIR